MRSFKTLLLGFSALGLSPSAAQDLPDEPRTGPVHAYDFEEGGASYTLTSQSEIVAPYYVSVARDVIRYCANMMIIQILPLNSPRETADELRSQARQQCQQQQLTDMKSQGQLPADATLTRR